MKDVRMRVTGMRAGELARIGESEILGDSDALITDICHDSRKAKPLSMFAAIVGERDDGHRYLWDAFQRGCRVALVSRPTEVPFESVLISKNVRRSLSHISHFFFGAPGERLKVIAVTGTKGKTTTTHLIAGIYESAGYGVGYIGTLGAHLQHKTHYPIENTTPESDDLCRILGQMADGGASVVSLEASSHGIKLDKLAGIPLWRSVFLNLTADHLDFHPDMDDYYASKKKLFTDVKKCEGWMGLVNEDDGYGSKISREVSGLVGFGFRNGEILAERVSTGPQGTEMEIVWQGKDLRFAVRSPLVGDYNAYNILTAVAVALLDEIPVDRIVRGISEIKAVPGRMEEIRVGQSFRVFVDYAHTAEALLKVLFTLRRVYPGSRLITVFGCGGNRDRFKRPKMGKVAVEFSDRVLITSDNPRHEDPQAIIADILKGIPIRMTSKVEVVEDREKAIEKAIRGAGPGDVVLIAGKGHETYQIIGNQRIPFDDRMVARRCLQELGYESDG
ncbi:MAG: UDP-N-acetylmuramoyl-L-alanyl-D-glutamate--2,6-diaminopimelate ligase [bacterium JZ-2024 1]